MGKRFSANFAKVQWSHEIGQPDQHIVACFTLTFMHLADAFIQSDLLKLYIFFVMCKGDFSVSYITCVLPEKFWLM